MIKALKSKIETLKNVNVHGTSSGASVVDTGDPLTWSEVLSRLNAIRLTNPLRQPYMPDSMNYMPIWYPEGYT